MARKPKPWNEYGGLPQHTFYQPLKIPFDESNPNFIDDLEENHHGGGYGTPSKKEKNQQKEEKKPVLDTPDEKLARLATEFVKAFNVSSDKGKEGYFRQVMRQTGHGGLLPPEDAAVARETDLSAIEPAKQPRKWLGSAADDKRTPSEPATNDTPPPEAWSDHKKAYLEADKSPAQFVIDQYSSQFGRGFSKATLRKDPLLYRDVLNWLRTHPMPDKLAPYFISKKELNDKRLAEIGGRITAETVPDLGERTRLHSVTYARARRGKPQDAQPI